MASHTAFACLEFSVTSAYDSEHRTVSAERFFPFFCGFVNELVSAVLLKLKAVYT